MYEDLPPLSYLGPADITEQLTSVQKSVMVPYSILIWLKKSTAANEKGGNNLILVLISNTTPCTRT